MKILKSGFLLIEAMISLSVLLVLSLFIVQTNISLMYTYKDIQNCFTTVTALRSSLEYIFSHHAHDESFKTVFTAVSLKPRVLHDGFEVIIPLPSGSFAQCSLGEKWLLCFVPQHYLVLL